MEGLIQKLDDEGQNYRRSVRRNIGGKAQERLFVSMKKKHAKHNIPNFFQFKNIEAN